MGYSVSQKTGLLWLIWHNFITSQNLLIIFGRDRNSFVRGVACPIDDRPVTHVDVDGTQLDVEATFCYKYWYIVCKLNVSTCALRSTTIAKYGQIAVMLSLSPSFLSMEAKVPGNESTMERNCEIYWDIRSWGAKVPRVGKLQSSTRYVHASPVGGCRLAVTSLKFTSPVIVLLLQFNTNWMLYSWAYPAHYFGTVSVPVSVPDCNVCSVATALCCGCRHLAHCMPQMTNVWRLMAYELHGGLQQWQ